MSVGALPCLTTLSCGKGDDANETALKALVPLCRAVVARYCPPWHPDFDDFCQEALIGAWEDLRGYDQTRGGELRPFVALCVRRKVFDLLKMYGRRGGESCVLDAPLWPDDGDSSESLADRLASGLPGPEDAAVLRQLVREFLAALSGLERDVVVMALRGMSYREMAAILGRDTKAVDNALVRARRKAHSLGLV